MKVMFADELTAKLTYLEMESLGRAIHEIFDRFCNGTYISISTPEGNAEINVKTVMQVEVEGGINAR